MYIYSFSYFPLLRRGIRERERERDTGYPVKCSIDNCLLSLRTSSLEESVVADLIHALQKVEAKSPKNPRLTGESMFSSLGMNH